MTMGIPTIRRPRAGFTLVELLVVIAIIAILASFVLGALYGSQEKAKETRSEATIAQLHTAIMDEWEGFRTRRMPVRHGIYANGTVVNPHATTGRSQETSLQFQLRRLGGLWQLMRMELPDRYKDLLFTPDINEPGRRKSYLRRIDAALATHNAKLTALGQSTLTAAQYAALIEQEHESSECLYLIVTVGLPPETRSVLKARDIGDTDGDSMMEILDGWGRPIHWLRWAPGFSSDLQPDADPTTTEADHNPLENHDQFDPLRLSTSLPSGKNPPPVDSGETAPPAWGFALVPLIYSAGSDGEYGIYELPQAGPITSAIANKNNNPYSRYNNSVKFVWRGSPNDSPDETRFDNIHNHLIGTR